MGDIDFKGMGLQIIGGIIFVVGVGLFVGNISGFFRTFPGAGYLTMALGGFLWKIS